MFIDVTGFITCDYAAGRVPLPGGPVHASGRGRVEHRLGPPGLGTTPGLCLGAPEPAI